MKTAETIENIIRILLWCVAIGGSMAVVLAFSLAFYLNKDAFMDVFKSGDYVPVCPVCKSIDLQRITLKHPSREVEKCNACGYVAQREEFENEGFKTQSNE